MKGYFFILILLLCAGACFGQETSKKPLIGQAQDQNALPPGTIKVEVTPLVNSFKDLYCKQEMKQISLRVVKVISLGSSLINSLATGDSLNVRVPATMDLSIEELSPGDALLLKEQLCSFEETYYTVIRKE